MPNISPRFSTSTSASRVRFNPSVETSGRRSARTFDSIRGNVEIVTPLPRGFKISPRAPLTEIIEVRRDLGRKWVGDVVAMPIGDFTEQASAFRIKNPLGPGNVSVNEWAIFYFFKAGLEPIIDALYMVSTRCAVRAETFKATRTRTGPRKWRVQKQRTP
jgi:hypothetical protein